MEGAMIKSVKMSLPDRWLHVGKSVANIVLLSYTCRFVLLSLLLLRGEEGKRASERGVWTEGRGRYDRGS